MAHARLGPGSDVYVYATRDGTFVCADCLIGTDFERFPTAEAIIAHLEEHVAKGDLVPEGVIEDIRQEGAENRRYNTIAGVGRGQRGAH